MLKESSEIRTFEELSLTKGFWRTVPLSSTFEELSPDVFAKIGKNPYIYSFVHCCY
jgi:hypothetical protein